MFQPVSVFIGLRYSRSRKKSGFVSFITLFSVIGILLGVASLITVVSVMNGFEGELKRRILGIVPQIVLDVKSDVKGDNSSGDSKASPQSWQQLQQAMLGQTGVIAATPYNESEALIQSHQTLRGVLMQGVEPQIESQHSIIAQHMVSGRLTRLEAGGYKAVIGLSLARALGVREGDKIRLVLPTKTMYTPMGRVPVQRSFTVIGIFHVGSQVDDQMVMLHIEDAARLLGHKKEPVDKLRLYLEDAFQAEQTASQIQNQYPDIKLQTWMSSQGTLFEAVRMEKNMMWLMLSLIIAVAAFNIVSALVMVVIDKQGEIGILQTLGLSSSGVLKIFMVQGVVNGLWGACLGTISGVLLTLNLNDIMSILGINYMGGYQAQNLPVIMEPVQVVIILGSAILMSFLATIYPAYRATQIQPAEVLRNE